MELCGHTKTFCVGEFWSDDLGLILGTISFAVLVFVIMPLREAGLSG